MFIELHRCVIKNLFLSSGPEMVPRWSRDGRGDDRAFVALTIGRSLRLLQGFDRGTSVLGF